eukprot:342945-Amphidinium_carterae.1
MHHVRQDTRSSGARDSPDGKQTLDCTTQNCQGLRFLHASESVRKMTKADEETHRERLCKLVQNLCSHWLSVLLISTENSGTWRTGAPLQT